MDVTVRNNSSLTAVTLNADSLDLDVIDGSTPAQKGFSIDKAVIDLDKGCMADIGLEELNMAGCFLLPCGFF